MIGEAARRWAFLFALFALLTAACRTVPPAAGPHPVLLISFDGFRWDYLEKAPTPNLDRLAREGLKAERLIPIFPTKTFPNHYSMVTGLYPEDHGIVANNMHDPELGRFRLSKREAVEDPRWWEGEPIWVSLRKRGLVSATLFWPGSEAPIGGYYPSIWERYDSSLPYRQRVDRILQWLEKPESERPRFVAAYFAAVDTAGHDFGTDSAEVRQAIGQLDRMLGQLMGGLETRRRLDSVNLIVVSDHGMADLGPDQLIWLDDYIDLDKVEVIDWSPVLAIRPRGSSPMDVYEALSGAHPHWTVYRKEDLPHRFRIRGHRRVAPVIAVADEGWEITSRERHQRRQSEGAAKAGEHGFDNQLLSMHGIFLARGPAFPAGRVIEPFENVRVYDLIAHLVGLDKPPKPIHLDFWKPVLKEGFRADPDLAGLGSVSSSEAIRNAD